MIELIKISWRNVWRHKLRSLVMITGIALGLIGGILAMSLGYGMIEQRFEESIEKQVSHIQVHNNLFLNQREIIHTIPQGEEIKDFLLNHPKVRAVSTRTITMGMIASASNSAGAQVLGINPQLESSTTQLHDQLIEGELPGTSMANSVVIGRKLSEKLKVTIGNRIVLTFQDVDGEITSAAFRISGKFTSLSPAIEERFVYVNRDELNDLLGLENESHEIAFLLYEGEEVNDFAAQLANSYPQAFVRTWREVSPELRYLQETSAQTIYIFIIIILVGLAFGILNIMLMAVFERTREIGMLMAIGMNKKRVFAMVLLETVFLTITGGIAGMFISSIIVDYLYRSGIDFGAFSEALSQFGYDTMVYPNLPPENYLTIGVLVILTAFIASIYPAIKALKLKPAEAVRKI